LARHRKTWTIPRTYRREAVVTYWVVVGADHAALVQLSHQARPQSKQLAVIKTGEECAEFVVGEGHRSKEATVI
jgi:hypothetical protein